MIFRCLRSYYDPASLYNADCKVMILYHFPKRYIMFMSFVCSRSNLFVLKVIDRFIAFASSLGIDLGFGTYDVFYRYKALRGLVRERRYESALQSVGYTLGRYF